MTPPEYLRGSFADARAHAPKSDPRVGQDDGLRFLHWAGRDPQAATIVLLHGMGDGADVWHATVDALQDTHAGNILAVELPGHWGSQWCADGHYGLPDTAARVCQVIKRQVAGPVCLAGHSLGGRIVTYIAAREIIPLQTVVLIDMNPDPGDDGMHAVHDHVDALNHAPFDGAILTGIAVNRLPLCAPDAVRQYLCAATRSLPDHARHSVDPSVLDFDMTEAGLPLDCWKLLAEIRCPVAILRGALSSILPAPVAHRAAMSLRSCRGYFVVSKAGHAIPLEQPKTLAGLIQRCADGKDTERSALW